jgi:dihydropteroate synthase
MIWKLRNRELEIGRRTLVMGILNVTPDSFSDGGAFLEPDAAVERAKRMLAEGADLVDIGGESTRPGADPVPVEEEVRRVVPVVARVVRETGGVVSVDTRKARVAEEALAAGAEIVNDVSALRDDPRMADVVARMGCGVVLMHMQGDPKTMQRDPRYGDVVADVTAFLRERGRAAFHAGVLDEAIVYDPGLGFGKTYEHNLVLLRRLPELVRALGRPVVVGPSRKSFVGTALGGVPPDARLEGTAAAVAAAVLGGASVVRVHDVAAMTKVAKVADAIRSEGRLGATGGA